MEWAEKHNMRLEYIQPRKAQQDAYIERYNRTVRPSHRNFVSTAGQWDEWLGQYFSETIEEAQDQATEWLWTCNSERPNMGIGGMTPAMKLNTAARILRLDPLKNGGITKVRNPDLSDFRCKCANVRFGAPFNKRWFLRGCAILALYDIRLRNDVTAFSYAALINGLISPSVSGVGLSTATQLIQP